jgi:sodium transport system permease protein
MRSNYVKTVFFKEIKDAFRDRKTIATTLLLPLVLYPLMFFLMDRGFGDLVSAGEGDTVVAVMGSERGRDILALNPGIQIRDSGDALAALESGEVAAVLQVTELPGGKLDIQIVYDDKRTSSTASVNPIADAINQYNQNAVDAWLAERGTDMQTLSPAAFEPVTLAATTGQTDGGNAGMMLSMMAPMLLVMLLAVGGMATASDLFAGEKERRTMEPLLCTRAGRTSILTGKLFAVTAFALLNVTAAVAGLTLSYVLSPNLFRVAGETAETAALTLPVPAALLTVLLVLIMALVFSGLHVVIAAYARTTKEAATYGSFVMLFSFLPMFSTMMMGAGDVGDWMMFVPVLNVIGSLKMLLGGVSNHLFLLVSIAVSAVFLAAVMAAARWLFHKETIMLTQN